MTLVPVDPGVRPLAEGFAPPADAAWRALAEASLSGRPLDSLDGRTDDGLVVPVLVTAADAAGAAARAATATALVPDGAWDVRQAHGHPDPATCNAQLLEDLEGGATSLIVGVDPDGVRGTVVRSPDDLARTLDGVLVELAPVHLAPAARWEAIGEAHRAWLAARDADRDALRGGLSGGMWRFETERYPWGEAAVVGWARFDPADAGWLVERLVDGIPWFGHGLAAASQVMVLRSIRSRVWGR